MGLASGGKGEQQLTKIDVSENHYPEPLNGEGRLEHQMVMVTAETERHEVWNVKSTKDFTETKVEIPKCE